MNNIISQMLSKHEIKNINDEILIKKKKKKSCKIQCDSVE